MKTISDYTICCTEEQTKKALELGAPIIRGVYAPIVHYDRDRFYVDKENRVVYDIPTAEQIVGWMEDQGFEFYNYKPVAKWIIDVTNGVFYSTTKECNTHGEATLVAIDIVLDYLSDKRRTSSDGYLDGYLGQFTDFFKKPKVFTVRFYKEHEDNNGYWNERDIWVHGETIQETITERAYLKIEDALSFADETQTEILESEQKRCNKMLGTALDLKWQSEYPFGRGTLITARLNWCGSDYRMEITYKETEEEIQ